MNHGSIICKPKPYYWLFGILIAPFAGLIFTSVLVQPILKLVGINLIGKELVILMVTVALISALWMYFKDYRKMRFEVNNQAIILGRHPFQKVIPISEISTVIIGLPNCASWWIRLLRFLPAFPTFILQRKQTILLRLSNQRLLPICLNVFPFLQRPNEFTQHLLLLLSDKIVSCENYTDIESKALCRLRLNKIIHLPERGTS